MWSYKSTISSFDHDEHARTGISHSLRIFLKFLRARNYPGIVAYVPSRFELKWLVYTSWIMDPLSSQGHQAFIPRRYSWWDSLNLNASCVDGILSEAAIVRDGWKSDRGLLPRYKRVAGFGLTPAIKGHTYWHNERSCPRSLPFDSDLWQESGFFLRRHGNRESKNFTNPRMSHGLVSDWNDLPTRDGGWYTE